jgi:hypothetical protein
MGNASYAIRWVKFDFTDPNITEVYVMIDAFGDCPISVQGCHYKAYPAEMSAVDILKDKSFLDHVLWPLKSPE